VGKALHRYDMIADGDRILVGLSGGLDSMTLLWILHERLQRVPIRYDLHAVYVDPGFEGGFSRELAEYCRKAGFSLTVEHTDDGLVAHSEENRENPCFLCSRRRRRRLFEFADSLGCGKIALGHNRDDIVETFFMNMCYAGEISTMRPSQVFFKGRFTIIRPLAYTEERLIRRFAGEHGFPRFENPCPSAGHSKRQQIRDWLQLQYRTNRKIRGNIFRALHNVRQDYLLK
jgi:tRNA 2-thiocytidine biosynthesis protein TtcA